MAPPLRKEYGLNLYCWRFVATKPCSKSARNFVDDQGIKAACGDTVLFQALSKHTKVGSVRFTMPYTNAKLLINAYARKAGDAARMKLYHLPKTKVHLPPKEIPSSLKVAGQRLNGNLRYAVFVVAKKQKTFLRLFHTWWQSMVGSLNLLACPILFAS